MLKHATLAVTHNMIILARISPILVMNVNILHSTDRAASMCVCGKQNMRTELCVRTDSVCEFVRNKEHYLHPEVTSFHGGFTDDRKHHG